ncbi:MULTISPECIES: YqaE/Pmp3 family membrane protein [unclassified Leeuwenhoekiella]|uniref:YqaE/Pmp3 family membrane protein n=1 Tax=unclassified Leeuwenhoekiella TaxID=2615029 RepID=UPI0009DF92B4|nr:YqaE/Pmp3 family membrane protein [Leeuwenhoekiella sp. MAR_2009_132]MDP5044378.1 YqaE/Pmp3 family membrane protein [Leeuwenhoekiella sp.]
MSILTILITIILPPLAVAMNKGIGKDFIINVILTLLGWLPGVIHAFYVNSRG